MDCQPEAIGEQSLHHQTHLVFGRIAGGCSCVDGVAVRIGSGPLWQLRDEGSSLVWSQPEFVGKLDVDLQWKISREDASGGGVGVVGTQRKVWRCEGTGPALMDGSDVEGHPPACGCFPLRWCHRLSEDDWRKDRGECEEKWFEQEVLVVL